MGVGFVPVRGGREEEIVNFWSRLLNARQDILAEWYSPCGVLEEELVRSIIETRWQLRRATLVDSELFQIYSIYQGQNRGVGTAFAQDATQGNAFSKLTHCLSFLLHKLRLAERDLLELKAQSNQALPIASPALICQGESQPKTVALLEDGMPKEQAEAHDARSETTST